MLFVATLVVVVGKTCGHYPDVELDVEGRDHRQHGVGTVEKIWYSFVLAISDREVFGGQVLRKHRYVLPPIAWNMTPCVEKGFVHRRADVEVVDSEQFTVVFGTY